MDIVQSVPFEAERIQLISPNLPHRVRTRQQNEIRVSACVVDEGTKFSGEERTPGLDRVSTLGIEASGIYSEVVIECV